MAHHISAKKRIRTTARRTAINKIAVSKIKTLTKKVLGCEDKEAVTPLYKEAVSYLDKNVAKGRLHRNTAARRKSALTKHFNELTAVKA